MYLATAGLLDINGTFIADLIAFLIMLAILSRWAYPPIIRWATARQQMIADHLEASERARREAEERLRQVEAQLEEARHQAQEIIEAARRSGEQLRQELREKGDEEAKRVVERGQETIASEREQALQGVRADLAEMVVAAAERVLQESLDGQRQRRLIEQAIEEVTVGERQR